MVYKPQNMKFKGKKSSDLHNLIALRTERKIPAQLLLHIIQSNKANLYHRRKGHIMASVF